MRKNDLVDLRADMGRVARAIEALEAHDAYWETQGGEIPGNVPEVGRLRMKLTRLQRTILRTKLLPREVMKDE